MCALLAATVVVLTACGTTSPRVAAQRGVPSTATVAATKPAWMPPQLPAPHLGVSACGLAYLVQAEGRTISLGTCSGILPTTLPHPLVVTTGAVFYVRVTHEMSGGRLDFPVPRPATDSVVRTAKRGPIVQYRAGSPGTSYLLARHTPFCAGVDPHLGTCRVLQVVVKPG